MGRLVSRVNRWGGTSTEVKPEVTASNPIPTGSEFFEFDTGRTAIWNGLGTWTYEPNFLQEILEVQREQLEILKALPRRQDNE